MSFLYLVGDFVLADSTDKLSDIPLLSCLEVSFLHDIFDFPSVMFFFQFF